MIGTRGSVDNQDKIVSEAVWCGLNIPHPLHCRCKVCLKKLYGGCSAGEESRVCAACGEEVCEDCSCAGAGAGDTVTLRTETRQQRLIHTNLIQDQQWFCSICTRRKNNKNSGQAVSDAFKKVC